MLVVGCGRSLVKVASSGADEGLNIGMRRWTKPSHEESHLDEPRWHRTFAVRCVLAGVAGCCNTVEASYGHRSQAKVLLARLVPNLLDRDIRNHHQIHVGQVSVGSSVRTVNRLKKKKDGHCVHLRDGDVSDSHYLETQEEDATMQAVLDHHTAVLADHSPVSNIAATPCPDLEGFLEREEVKADHARRREPEVAADSCLYHDLQLHHRGQGADRQHALARKPGRLQTRA